ncbi:amidohydrolase family protein [Cytobacillus sp. FJAT-53684]|uniref:Amidohydrolase family protein n=1 Tax=Cytobacillus mangrovibacter TaxID=3299024 RepID=A0ABW6K2N0_9BACI
MNNPEKNNISEEIIRPIDCDVHPVVEGGLEQLYPYMDSSWKKKFQMSGLVPHSNRHVNPRGSVTRKDAISPEGKIGGSDPFFTREQYLDVYDPKCAALIAMQPSQLSLVWTNPDMVHTVTSAYNDYFIDKWLSVDPRYHLVINVTPQDPKLAVKEIKRLSKVKGVIGINLPLINIPLGDRYFYPIFEAAIEENLPIMTHVTGAEGTYIGAAPLAGGVTKYYVERYITYPQIAQSTLVNLIFEGVFERYPDLKIVFVEYAFSWLGSVLTRMDQSWRNLRIETPWVKKKPSDYVRDNVYFTTQPIDEMPKKQFDSMIGMIEGEHNLLFSSDYPHWDNDMPDETFNRLFSSPELRKRILHDNAMNLFGSRIRA